MPRNNAAEAMPMPEPKPQEEVEELPQDLLKEEEPEEPTNDTKEALEDLRKISIQRDMEAAAEERKKILETRDKASTERMHRALGASVLHELPPEDVKLDDESSWANEAERAIGPRKKAEPPPIPAAAKKPEAKKPWYKRLFGSKE